MLVSEAYQWSALDQKASPHRHTHPCKVSSFTCTSQGERLRPSSLTQRGQHLTFRARNEAWLQSTSRLTLLLSRSVTESNIFPCVFRHCLSHSLKCSKLIFLCRKTALSIWGVLTLCARTKSSMSPLAPPCLGAPQQARISLTSAVPRRLPSRIKSLNCLHLSSPEITQNALE